MSERKLSRRQLLKGAGLATASGAAFFGPWKHNHMYASAADKPIRIGMTSDASGQYANSGASDRRGMPMAVCLDERSNGCTWIRKPPQPPAPAWRNG